MPTELAISADLLAADVVFILQCLLDNLREGRSTHMMDVRDSFGASVTLGFSEYLRFLKQFGYVTLSAEHVLAPTPLGRQVAGQGAAPALVEQLQLFFAHKLSGSSIEIQTEREEHAVLEAVEAPSPSWMAPPKTTPPPIRSKPVARPAAAAASPYVMGDPIGRGPNGRVVRARHSTLLFEVAIKEIRDLKLIGGSASPQLLSARLKREVSAQARLKHPAIVQIYDLDQAGTPLIIEELCEGGNLRGRLGPAFRASATELLRTFVQLLDALAAAEAEGFTHGNIKAENILFDRFGNAKLSDFGLSRLAGQSDEQAAVSDLQALGALLYEALAAQPHSSMAPFLSKVNPEVPGAVDWVLDKMTAGDPTERYQDAGAARDAFLSALADPIYGRPGEVPVMTSLAPPEEVDG